MKKIFLTIVFALVILFPTVGQFQVNPIIGLNLTRSTLSPTAGIKTKGAYGLTLGVDFRIGKRFYIQPGAYFSTNRTIYEASDSLNTYREPVDRNLFGAKLWVGFKILNSKNIKLRVALGPSYDYFLKTKVRDNLDFLKEDFSKGSFNLDGNVGISIWRISLDVSYTLGLTKTFDAEYFSKRPKYQRLTITVGYVFGKLGGKVV